MRLFLALLFFAQLATAQIITNNLIADYQAGVGYTLQNGYIATWADQHNLLNNDGVTNDAVQAESAEDRMPLADTDAQGMACVLFRYGFPFSGTNVARRTNTLTIAETLVSHSRTSSVYAVCTGPIAFNAQAVWQFTNWDNSGWIQWDSNSDTIPMRMLTVSQRSTNIIVGMNKAIFANLSSPSVLYQCYNLQIDTNAAVPALALQGAEIGGNRMTRYFSGRIYRILVYRGSHTPAQYETNRAALAAQYNVQQTYTRQVICRGESNTRGDHATNLQSWPWWLVEQMPELKVYNHGQASSLISTNGSSGNVWVGRDTLTLDPIFNTNLVQNAIIGRGSGNEFIGAISGTNTYIRLTNWSALRVAAGWKVYIDTLSNGDPYTDLQVTNFNALIRNPGASYWSGVSDSGVGSPQETRLSDKDNTTYFDVDGLHLTSGGQRVIFEHAQQHVNQHRRVGAFFP